MTKNVLTPVIERLRAKVSLAPGQGPNGDCWEYQGAVGSQGYCVIGLGRREDGTDYVHRVVFREEVGPIPEGEDVCHTCDNRKCCRPSHLFAGTRKLNMEDCVAKGRTNKGKFRVGNRLIRPRVRGISL